MTASEKTKKMIKSYKTKLVEQALGLGMDVSIQDSRMFGVEYVFIHNRYKELTIYIPFQNSTKSHWDSLKKQLAILENKQEEKKRMNNIDKGYVSAKSVSINFRSPLNNIFKQLMEVLPPNKAKTFEINVRQSVDMYARNGQMAKKDVAAKQLIDLASRYGVDVEVYNS